MGAISDRLLELARAELGTREFPPGSNKVKYNDAFDWGNIHWCLVFIWWLFRELGIQHLFFDGEKCAYVPAFQDWARKQGLLVKEPRAGDLICFDFNGNGQADHIGLCESWDGTYITTIDGNTGVGNEANGGAVMRRRRHKQYIVAVIRPRYEKREDEDMGFCVEDLTDEQVLQLAERLNGVLKEKPPSGWSDEAREWAEINGYINGDENGNMQYKKFCTREEVIQLMYNAKH